MYFSPKHWITNSLRHQPRPRKLESLSAVKRRRDDHVADTESQEGLYSLGSKGPIQDFFVESVEGEDDEMMRSGSGGTESMSVVKSEFEVDDGGHPSYNISKSFARATPSQAVHPAPLDAHHRRLALTTVGLSTLAIFVQ
ncbi:hypothetical protein EC968_006590 [Mortierella alpina]|nr:hypothetical protein EC968_006590 [Mortierella alpina]